MGGVAGLDFLGTSFAANATLRYSENSDHSGGTLAIADNTHSVNIALLGQYMALSFAIASDGHGGTLITDPSSTALNQQTLFSQYQHA
jgi:hypothetical protein